MSMNGVPRRSYSRLVKLPAFGLYDADDKLVASVRAGSIQEAVQLFRDAGLKGHRVTRL